MAPTYQGNFVFINKDASNLDARNKDEAFTISSHVTHTYYHWAKHRQDSRSRAKATLNPKGSCSTPGSRSGSPEIPVRNSKSKTSRHTPYLNSWASFPTTVNQLSSDARHDGATSQSSRHSSPAQIRNPRTIDCPRAISQASHHNRLALPVSILGHGNSDPFNSTPLPITPLHNELMHIWHCYFMTFTCPLGAGSRLRAVAEQKWQRRIADLVHDEAELNAWFASALTVKAKFFRPEDHAEIWPQALEHQSKALAGLRERLQSEEAYSERMILIIWSIATMNFYSGDWESNKVHQGAINRIVESMGGLDSLSPLTRLHVIVGDIVNANINLERPVYDFTIYDPGAWSAQPFAEDHNDLLPLDRTHFARWDEAFLESEDPLSTDVSEYLNSQREFVAVRVMTKTMPADRSERKDEILEWLHRRRMALRALCIELWCDLDESTDQISKTKSSVIIRRRTQQSVTLGANWLAWFAMNYENDILPKWLIYIPFPNLRRSLQALLDVMAARGRLYNLEVLLWLAFIGASAEEASIHAGVRPGMDEGWFSKRFMTVAGKMKLRTWREAKKVLKRFVYDESVLDRFVESLFAKRKEIEVVDLAPS